MNKRLIKLTENDLHKIVKESVNRLLNEQHIIRVQYDKELSRSRGRKYFYCSDNCRYYTNIDGEWLICTDNYNLEPDCHLENDVKVVVESVNRTSNAKTIKEGIDYELMKYLSDLSEDLSVIDANLQDAGYNGDLSQIRKAANIIIDAISPYRQIHQRMQMGGNREGSGFGTDGVSCY